MSLFYANFSALITRSDSLPAELPHLNVRPLEVMSRYREQQLQLGENYAYLFNFETKHLQILMFKHLFSSQ